MPNQPGSSAVHKDALLTNVAIAHKSPFDYLGMACATVPVNRKSGVYVEYTAEDWQRAIAADRSAEGDPNRIGYGLTQTQYVCVNKAIEATVSDDERDNADTPVRTDVDKTRLVMDALTMKRQVDIATMFTGASWTGSYDASSGTNTQWDEASAVPLDNLDTAFQGVADKIGIEPNVCITSSKIFRFLRKDSQISAFINGGATPQNPAMATVSVLKQIFPNIEKFIVVPTIRVTSQEGATTVRSNVWGNYFWTGYVAPNPSISTPSAAYCFEWRKPKITTYREQRNTRDVIQGIQSYVAKATYLDSGYMISNVLASF